MSIVFTAELWQHDGQGGWHFMSMPLPESEELKARTLHLARGFGSLRVRATVGATTWTTSVFPSSAGSYVLPVNKQVRRAEDLEAGDVLEVSLELEVAGRMTPCTKASTARSSSCSRCSGARTGVGPVVIGH